MMTMEDKIRAQAYCMYMIAGSYFKKCECSTPGMEAKCMLQYRELGDKRQIDGENKSIHLMEKVILPKLPKELMEEKVTASFVPNGETLVLRIRSKHLLLTFTTLADDNRVKTEHLEQFKCSCC